MANVLPQDVREDVEEEYHLRLGIVGLIFLCVAFLIGGLFLIPSYVLVDSRVDTIENQVSVLKERVQEDDGEDQYATALSHIEAKLEAANSDLKESAVGDEIRLVVENQSDAINIQQISYESSKNTLALAGQATTREKLLAFNERLKEEKAFASVNLPVSSLAKNVNVPFNIKITLSE